jgi:hypothetical protein
MQCICFYKLQGYFPDLEDKCLDANAFFTKWLRMTQKSGVNCGFTTRLKRMPGRIRNQSMEYKG